MPVFEELLREAGVILSTDENGIHCLKTEQVLVRRKLSKLLTPQKLPAFIRDLEAYMSNDERFVGCVQICTSTRRAMRTTSKQNTLVHILLMIQPLQKVVAQIVVEKLAHAIASDEIPVILSVLTSLHNVTLHEQVTGYLARSLLENIDVADRPVQLSLLEHIPKIVKGAQRSVVADHLIKLMEDNETLTKVIMNSLMELELTDDHIKVVNEFIAARLLDSQRHYENFALLFQFLIAHNNDKASVFRQTRDTMDKVMKQPELIDVKLALHEILMRFTAPDFHLVMQTYPKGDPKMIDFYLYLMMFTAEFDHKFGLNIIRRRIKLRELSNELIANCIEVMLVGVIFNDLFKPSIEFAVELIKGEHQECVKVGALIFQLLFTHAECNEVMQNRIIYTLNYILKITGALCHEVILSMMRNLSTSNKLTGQSANLMSFLELFPMLSLPHWHVLLEIICANVANKDEYLDDLRQYLQKFPVGNYRKHGIIAGVMLAMHLPTANRVNVEAAKSLLEFTIDRCINAECYGLYYDELDASLTSNTHAEILQWLNEDIVNNFSEKYLTSEIPREIPVPLKPQYELNTADEVDVCYLVNIGGFIQNPKERTSIVVLASLFRLLRHINCLQNDGDMDAIDALLGCGVLLPDTDNLELYNDAELKIVADCLFYCINWFRELVSGFVKQRANSLRIKVIKRIKHIVELQEKLNTCKTHFSSDNYYKLPASYFYGGQSNKRKYVDDEQESAKKKARKDSTLNVIKPTTKSLVGKTYHILHSAFRKIDTDVLILLKYPVTSPDATASQLKNLESKQFQFILRDCTEKLADAMCFDEQPAFYGQFINPKAYLEDCETFLPFVHRHFRHVSEEIANLVKDHDCDDLVMFRKPATDLKCSFDLVMEYYKLIFSWSGFKREENRELLRNSLKYFNHAEQTSLDSSFRHSMTQRSYNLLGREFVVNIAKYRSYCLLISSAASMLQLMANVIALLEHNIEACGKIVVETAAVFLKRRWLNDEGRADMDHAAMKIIVDAFLRHANVKTINGIVTKLHGEVQELKSKKECLKTFAAIDSSNLHILYRGLFQQLASCLSSDVRNPATHAEHLITWRYAAVTLQELMAIVKRPGKNRNLKIFVVFSVRIINMFITHGIAVMNHMLKTKSQAVDEISMLFQNCTKFLHQLCCQVAKNKISGFDSLVPIVRTTIETLIVRVKKMLVENQCNDAMWAGILKNKDVHGAAVLSQMTDSTSGDDEEVEDLVEDEDILESFASLDTHLSETEELHSESSVYASTQRSFT